MVVVTTVVSRIEAEVIKSFLHANGINAFITADDRGGATPYPMSPVSGVNVFVSAADLARAKALLAMKNTA